MKIEFKTKNMVFSANDEANTRNYLMNTQPMNEKVLKGFLLSKFNEYAKDKSCAQPLEKYQALENMVMGIVSRRKGDFGLKGVNLDKMTMFNNQVNTPYMNNHFKKQIASLSTSEYKKVINGFKQEVGADLIFNSNDAKETSLKIDNLKSARDERNPFVRFFLWLFNFTKAEDEIFDDMENTVENVCEDKDIAYNKPQLLKEEDYEKQKKTENSKVIPFSISDPDLDERLDEPKIENTPLTNEKFELKESMNRYLIVNNASIFAAAAEKYQKRENSFDYSKDQLKESFKELQDMGKVLGFNDNDISEIMKAENKLPYILEHSKTKYTKEEIDKYNGVKEKEVPEGLIEIKGEEFVDKMDHAVDYSKLKTYGSIFENDVRVTVEEGKNMGTNMHNIDVMTNAILRYNKFTKEGTHSKDEMDFYLSEIRDAANMIKLDQKDIDEALKDKDPRTCFVPKLMGKSYTLEDVSNYLFKQGDIELAK